jgi:hypothetical protein
LAQLCPSLFFFFFGKTPTKLNPTITPSGRKVCVGGGGWLVGGLKVNILLALVQTLQIMTFALDLDQAEQFENLREREIERKKLQN